MNMLSKSSKLLRQSYQVVSLRWKHKDTHWSVVAKKKQATNKALEHFDDFYKKVFEGSWTSIRHGLLGEKKYAAVLNYFGDTDETRVELENSGAINMRALFNLEKEYISERKKEFIKKKSLDEIYKLDKEIELKVNAEQSKKIKSIDNKILQYRENIEFESTENAKGAAAYIYEEINETSLKDETKNVTNFKSQSVIESLKDASFDYSRIISPDSVDISAALHEFVPATKLKGKEDWIPETQHYRYYESSNEFTVKVEKEYDLHFPEHLNVYCYERSNHTKFSHPKKGATNVYNYYLLDGASVLPVLALGLKPGDHFLDMCCAPGGKAYIALQTLYPDSITCNDVDYSRVNRINKVLNEYLYDLDKRWLSTGKLKIWQENGTTMSYQGFNKILVDAPCTNDRHSLHENDNNWFKGSRTKERLQLPETQAALLTNALKMVSVGGTVVYCTCSLSPIQNDGVVNMALRAIWEETDIELTVKDLSPALQCTKNVFRYADKNLLKYGHLILPYLPQNYGPMYFCKIDRNK